MKKFITMLLIGTLSFTVVSCGGTETPSEEPTPVVEESEEPTESEEPVVEESEESVEDINLSYVDGVYSAEAAEFSQSGWKDTVTVTVEGGAITDVVWTGYNEAGQDKIEESKAGNYNMNTELEWYEQSELMCAELIETQDPTLLGINAEGKTDTVSGVSVTVSDFVTLSMQALMQAVDMDAILEQAAAAGLGTLNDGEYTAETAEFSQSGWKDTVTITVQGGFITNAVWTGYNEAGQDKIEESKAGNYNMNSELEWYEQSELMAATLVATQDPSIINITADGKTDTVAGVSITVSDFVQLATDAINQAK